MVRYIIIFAAMMAGSVLLAWDPETKKIMPFVDDPKACLQCHTERDFGEFIQDPALTCDRFCLSCHKDVTAENHHSVGMKLTNISSNKVTLTRLGKIACITCHDLREQRFDTYPWMAQSLFDSMFKKQTQYKTYYLILQNDKGQLCRICH